VEWTRICEGCQHLMLRHRGAEGQETLPCAEPGCQCIYQRSVTHYRKVTTHQAIRMGLIEDVIVTFGEDEEGSGMYAFLMTRDDDERGISGRVVAEGVIFSDGRVAIRWMVPELPSSTVVWDSIADAMLVHNHNDDTHLAIASDIAWPPGHTDYEHAHKWKALTDHTVEGPWFCTDCGTYVARKPVEVNA
jgi:hypothetical protein